MGNSGSQQTGIGQSSSPSDHQEAQWSQSFPRTPYQYKLVVPDRDAHQKLRPTGNGEILQAGGTISGRNQQWGAPQGVSRSSSIPAARQRSLQQQRSQSKQNLASNGHANGRRENQHAASHRQSQMKRFGSEPDLRNQAKSNQEHQDRYKARSKKYKAPPPPPLLMGHNNDSINYDMENGSPIRRARLFKTRAESKKKNSSPTDNRRLNGNKVPQQATSKSGHRESSNSRSTTSTGGRPPPPMLQRNKSSPEFQAELMEVTRKLISMKKDSAEHESKLKTLDHNLIRKERAKSTPKNTKAVRDSLTSDEYVKEPAIPEPTLPKVKTFYFGMEQEDSQNVSNSIDSVSSESDAEQSRHDISLQLRPILPKKQLEIPRFSPATAWNLLSTVEPNQGSNASVSEDGFACIEARIEKQSRPPPPYRLQMGGPRSNHDKSGDSGISDDETPEAALPSPRHRGISWTPQQDLVDDSSLEDGSTNEFPTTKFPSKPHVFSLSLPRENHLATYMSEKIDFQTYSSLQKIKKSMSGILGGLAPKKGIEIEQDLGDNWFLSRSAPNSLNNGFNSLELRTPPTSNATKYDHHESSNTSPTNNYTKNNNGTRRIMYLPQSKCNKMGKKKHLSKSYENISVESNMLPENLQDPPRNETAQWIGKKPKKFTFQSTVRQIERKRLAEKLSKEAERKEQQRLREVEAMQKVEEEFQKKRAKEKASIRQQLRLYSMDDSAWSSLPPNLDITDEVRMEPEGAVSSAASSPTFAKSNNDYNKETKAPAMQVLSEYRQTQREYKEFRSGSRYVEQTTVHPKVTCNMPKATGSTRPGNYRKDFAHGIKSGESQTNRR